MKLNHLEKDLLKVASKHQAGYHQLANAMKSVRRDLVKEDWYAKPQQNRKIPNMPSTDQLKAFFKAFDSLKDPQYKLWVRMVYDCQIRVHELVNILVNEVNLVDRKILIHGKGAHGHGKKDRVVLFSSELAELLKIHIKNNSENIFLFQNKDGKRFTTRRVQQVFAQARKEAEIDFRMSPHIGRHVGLTHLIKNGFVATMDQSGHASEQSLGVYRHLAVDQFQPQFDSAMKSFWNDVIV